MQNFSPGLRDHYNPPFPLQLSIVTDKGTTITVFTIVAQHTFKQSSSQRRYAGGGREVAEDRIYGGNRRPSETGGAGKGRPDMVATFLPPSAPAPPSGSVTLFWFFQSQSPYLSPCSWVSGSASLYSSLDQYPLFLAVHQTAQ